jgi:heme-degrading monooxygenase HmoA
LIVVTTRFSVPGDEQSDFEQRLRDGVHLLQQPPGLIRNEVHRPCAIRFEQSSGQFVPQTRAAAQQSAAQYEVKTWWRSLEDFEEWTQGPAFQSREGRRALQETFTRAELLAVHEVFIESPRSGLR